MPIKLKEKSLDEMKKDAIKDSVDARGYAKGGMVKKPTAKGMHKMPDGKMMKNSAMKTGYAKGGMVEKPMLIYLDLTQV